MKNYSSSVITYVAALVVGILLLVFCHEPSLSKSIVIAIGILFIVPGILTIISSLTTVKIVNGVKKGHPYVLTAVGVVALALGLWMVFAPSFFISISVYTLGIALIVCGIASIFFVIEASRPFGAFVGWYILPVLTILAGCVICFAGPATTITFAAIFTGCFLICYAAGGLAGIGRVAKFDKQVEEDKKIEQK